MKQYLIFGTHISFRRFDYRSVVNRATWRRRLQPRTFLNTKFNNQSCRHSVKRNALRTLSLNKKRPLLQAPRRHSINLVHFFVTIVFVANILRRWSIFSLFYAHEVYLPNYCMVSPDDIILFIGSLHFHCLP